MVTLHAGAIADDDLISKGGKWPRWSLNMVFGSCNLYLLLAGD
jgi:hypothetical protein